MFEYSGRSLFVDITRSVIWTSNEGYLHASSGLESFRVWSSGIPSRTVLLVCFSILFR